MASSTQQSRGRRVGRALAMVLFIAAPVAIGYLIGSLAAGGDPAGAPTSLGWKLGLLAGIVPAMFIVLATHELGHVIGGWLVGFRLFLFVVGPLWIDRDEEGFRVRLNTNLGMAGGLAGTAPVAGDVGKLARRMTAMVAGGPIASVLLGVVALLADRGLGWRDAGTPTLDALGSLLVLTGFVSLGIAVVTLIPAHTSGFFTDGARLLRIFRGGATARADLALAAIVAWSLGGVRPRDWDAATVQALLGASGGSFLALGYHSAWRHALDRGDEEQATVYRDELARRLDDAPEVVRAALALELATDHALRGDVATARTLIDDAGAPSPFVDGHLRPLAEAAVAAARGDREAATASLHDAEAALPEARDPVARILDAERAARIRLLAG